MKNFIKKVLTVVITVFVFIVWLIPVFCISAVLYCFCWLLGFISKGLLLIGLVLMAICYNGFNKGFSVVSIGELSDYLDKVEKEKN
jgi:hypothetical protein